MNQMMNAKQIMKFLTPIIVLLALYGLLIFIQRIRAEPSKGWFEPYVSTFDFNYCKQNCPGCYRTYGCNDQGCIDGCRYFN